MKNRIITVIYSVILGIFCSLIPISVGELTAKYRLANAKAEELRNIFDVLEISFTSDQKSDELVKIFEDKVVIKQSGDLKLFVTENVTDSIKSKAVAIHFTGPGVWGAIKGYIALESDLQTIKGIAFYQQEETPGLGGEIGTTWFRNKFKGKKIIDETGKKGFFIRRTGSNAINEIDGISGATLTCDKVQNILNSLITHIDAEAKNAL